MKLNKSFLSSRRRQKNEGFEFLRTGKEYAEIRTEGLRNISRTRNELKRYAEDKNNILIDARSIEDGDALTEMVSVCIEPGKNLYLLGGGSFYGPNKLGGHVSDGEIEEIILKYYGDNSNWKLVLNTILSLKRQQPQISPGGEPYWLNSFGQMANRKSGKIRKCFNEIAGLYGRHLNN